MRWKFWQRRPVKKTEEPDLELVATDDLLQELMNRAEMAFILIGKAIPRHDEDLEVNLAYKLSKQVEPERQMEIFEDALKAVGSQFD